MDAQRRDIKQDPLIAQMGNTVQLQNVSINIYIKFLFLRCNEDKAQAKITEKTQTEIEGKKGARSI